MCRGKIVIPLKLQSYVLNFHHAYLLHPVIDRVELMICQHLYWPSIRESIRKEVSNCDTYQFTKRSNKQSGKLPAKVDEEIPWNKLCVDLICPYIIHRKGKKENLNLKAVTMINPVTGWFEIMQFNDTCAITIANLVEIMWLTRYPWPIEIT